MEAVEESEPNVLREIASEEELAQIPRELTRKINAHFNAKFEEFITAKAVFETSRKCLEQNLETAQKELAEQKLDLDECRGKLELAEKSNTEICSNLEEVKIEVHRLQESVKRLEKENCELRRQRDTVTDEANALQLQVSNSMKLSSDESKELSRCSLSALPNEILLKTFKYLDLKTLCRMNEVNNRRFDILTRDPRLYTRLNMRDKSEKYMCDIFYYFTPRCKYLQQLDLKGSYFHVNDFINFLNNCGRRLTHLNLSYCTIHYSSTVFQLSFEISKTCKDLKELDLRFCQGMEYGIDVDNDDDEFLYLERLNNLECIMFSRLPITTENICKILQNNPQIREVDMGVSMNDEILITLANSCRDLEVIRTLFISTDGHITSQGISALANCKNLQKVHLIFSYKYPVNDDSLFRLFSSYQHLQEIHLFFPVLTDHRLELLAQCKNLKKLYLDCVKDLDDPDKYSIILKQCPKLQKFSLTRCNISDRLVDQWRERYPHVSVYTKN